jgi:cell division protein FtsB
MRNPNEIEQSLVELEGELEQLNNRRAEILKQITDLIQGMISSLSKEEIDPQTCMVQIFHPISLDNLFH